VHCEVRGSEFICGSLSHVHIYEQGGLATLMGAHPRALSQKNDGTIDLDDIRAAGRAATPGCVGLVTWRAVT
jgi:threonine aldolase